MAEFSLPPRSQAQQFFRRGIDGPKQHRTGDCDAIAQFRRSDEIAAVLAGWKEP